VNTHPELPANIRLRYKLLTMTNTPAYANFATITAVKSFVVQAEGSLNVYLGISMGYTNLASRRMAHFLR